MTTEKPLPQHLVLRLVSTMAANRCTGAGSHRSGRAFRLYHVIVIIGLCAASAEPGDAAIPGRCQYWTVPRALVPVEASRLIVGQEIMARGR